MRRTLDSVLEALSATMVGWLESGHHHPTGSAVRIRTEMARMYTKSIVTFIDILGFRQLVGSRSASEIADIVDVFQKFSGDPDGDDPLGLKVVSFSDSVIRVRPASVTSGLWYELLGLLHAQGELIAKGVLVRGGVAFGDVLLDGTRVFGPAFIEAYDMESQFAVHPRIAVAPSTLAAFHKGDLPAVHPLGEEASYIKKLLTTGDDGVWYIDYLRAFASEVDDYPGDYVTFLSKHKEAIEGRARSFKAHSPLSSLSLKINWLAGYHDAVVSELSESGLRKEGYERSDLFLDAAALPHSFRFPG